MTTCAQTKVTGWHCAGPAIVASRIRRAITKIYFLESLRGMKRTKPPSSTFTPAQVEFHGAWRGQIAVVRSIEEALRVIERGTV